jgi:NodT family efflux transporter outer membrane factor (OMF) lipoprotein
MRTRCGHYFLAGLSCMLFACAAPQPGSRPAPDIPEQWNAPFSEDARAWPEAEWWQLFGSEELAALVIEGRANNLEIAAAVARVRQAESAARLAGAPLLPHVSTSAGAAKYLLRSGNEGSLDAGLQLSYETDFWGKNRASLNAAKASLRADRFARETVALTVTSGIVSTYLQALSLRDQIAVAKENVANAERVLKLVEAQGRAGSASPLDLARQRSAVASQKAIIPDLIEQEREARLALSILLGRPSQDVAIGESGLRKILLPQVRPGLPSGLLARRPDIRRAEAALDAASANIARARAAFFPDIQLSGSAGAQSNALLSLFNSQSILLTIGADLVAPIFDAGRLENRRALAAAQQEELLQVYRSTVMSAFAEVNSALGQIHSLAQQSELKSGELDQAELAFRLSEIRYRAGAEDLMTVLDTQRALSEVRNDMGQLKLRQLRAVVGLYKALGGGWKDRGMSG